MPGNVRSRRSCPSRRFLPRTTGNGHAAWTLEFSAGRRQDLPYGGGNNLPDQAALVGAEIVFEDKSGKGGTTDSRPGFPRLIAYSNRGMQAFFGHTGNLSDPPQSRMDKEFGGKDTPLAASCRK
jgi:hypothetical protein